MSTIKRFEDLGVWQNARELTNHIYSLSARDDIRTDFGLRNQIRRDSVSVMSNIAEGFESHTTLLFIRYLGLSRASAGELRSHLFVASDMKYISEEELKTTTRLLDSINKQLYRLVQYLKTKTDFNRI